MNRHRRQPRTWLLTLVVALVGATCSGSTAGQELPCDFDGYQAALTVIDPSTGSIESTTDVPWPGFHGPEAFTDGTHLYLATEPGLVAFNASGQVAWDLAVPVRRDGILFDSEGRILLVTRDQKLRGVDSGTGSELWSVELSGEASGNVVVVGTVALVPTGKSLQALATSDGAPLWASGDLPRRPPRAAGGLVFGPTTEREQIRAVDAISGTDRFVAELPARRRARHALAASDGVVFIEELHTEKFQGGPETVQVSQVVALDSSTGEILWRAPAWAGQPNGVSMLDDVLLVPSPENGVGVVAYDPADGGREWSLEDIRGNLSVGATGRDHYFMMELPGWSNPQRLVAVARRGATIAWEAALGEDAATGIAVGGGVLTLVGQVQDVRQDEPGGGFALGIDPKSGTEVWTVELRDAAHGSPSVVGDRVHVLTSDEPVLCGD